ncbi:hypothetical protein Ndes2526A_g01413 [Nannochloris sp. 'desiccata']
MASGEGLIVDGLRNQGNICYFNSILQALASCNLVLDSLQRIQSVVSDGGVDSKTQICQGLLDIIKYLQPHSTDISRRSYSAQTLLRTLRTKLGDQDVLPLGEEHDAAEGLELLLQALSSEISAAFHAHAKSPLQIKAALQALLNSNYSSSPCSNSQPDALLAGWKSIRLPVEGLMATRMQCVKCRHHFDTQFTQFTTLSMPLPTTSASKGGTAVAATGNLLGIAHVPSGCSLIPCFDGLFGYELVSGVHCPGCSIKASLKQVAKNLPVDKSKPFPPLKSPSPSLLRAGKNNNTNKNQATVAPLDKLQNSVDERRPLPSQSSVEALFQAEGIPYLEQTQTHVTRQSVVVRWPSILVLQLRRSIWTPDGRLVKVVGHVKFPLALRLEAKDDQKLSYHLKAVVLHSGLSAGTGHYTTFRKLQEVQSTSSKWVKVSDESVKPVDEAEVLAADAILLLYEHT